MQPSLYGISLGTETGLDNPQRAAKTRLQYFQDDTQESVQRQMGPYLAT